MLEVTRAMHDARESEVAAAEPQVAPGSKTGARWISLTARCGLASVNCCSMASDVWQSRVEAARADGVAKLGDRPVRMSLRTIRGVDR